MEREAILQVLRAPPDNRIWASFHRSVWAVLCIRKWLLIRHYGSLIPDEIVLKLVMLKVQDDLCVTDLWGSYLLGGCTWRRLPKQGWTLGVRGKMLNKLGYLWRSCSGELLKQNDLFWLTDALETAKKMHWIFRLLTYRVWTGRNAVPMDASVNAIYLPVLLAIQLLIMMGNNSHRLWPELPVMWQG